MSTMYTGNQQTVVIIFKIKYNTVTSHNFITISQSTLKKIEYKKKRK